jgi:anti-sigma factor RsiW
MMNDDSDNLMMPIDADVELLESYLDGALDPADHATLETRLAADAELAATLGELRSQRDGRRAVWAALEPDQVTVDRLNWRVRGAVAAELNRPAVAGADKPRWAYRPDPWSVARFTGAAAACVLLGFFGGRLGRAPVGPPSVAAGDPIAMHRPSPASGPTAVATAGGGVNVPITDEYGRVIANQPCENADQARRFLEDLRRVHADAPPATPVDGQPPRLASEIRY